MDAHLEYKYAQFLLKLCKYRYVKFIIEKILIITRSKEIFFPLQNEGTNKISMRKTYTREFLWVQRVCVMARGWRCATLQDGQ